jgi:hypothetical protein
VNSNPVTGELENLGSPVSSRKVFTGMLESNKCPLVDLSVSGYNMCTMKKGETDANR